MDLRIRPATPDEAPLVSSILKEAATSLRDRGIPLWTDAEIALDRIAPDVQAGLYFLAELDGTPAGTLRFQLSDPEFWPDVPDTESAFVHRLAVRPSYSGRGVGAAMLLWAADYARGFKRRYLRLDCDAARPRLRKVYEDCGFRHHSDRYVGRFYVARYELPLAAGLARVPVA